MLNKQHLKTFRGSQLLIINPPPPTPDIQGLCNIAPISPVLTSFPLCPALQVIAKWSYSHYQIHLVLCLCSVPVSTCQFSILQTDFTFFREYFSSRAPCKRLRTNNKFLNPTS